MLKKQLNAGKNPDELGRVRIRLSWNSIDDEVHAHKHSQLPTHPPTHTHTHTHTCTHTHGQQEEQQCQRIWAEQMKNPIKRKLMKHVMTSWIRGYQHKGFEALKRQVGPLQTTMC